MGANPGKNEGQKERGEAWLKEIVGPLSDRVSGRSLARALNVSPSTVSRWIDLGRIDFVELAGKRFLTRSAIKRFFDQNVSASQSSV
jgi:hypothetical protein